MHPETITFRSTESGHIGGNVSGEARPCSLHLGGEWKVSANNDNVRKAAAAYPTLSNNEVKALCLNFGFAWKKKQGQWTVDSGQWTEDRWRIRGPSTPLV